MRRIGERPTTAEEIAELKQNVKEILGAVEKLTRAVECQNALVQARHRQELLDGLLQDPDFEKVIRRVHRCGQLDSHKDADNIEPGWKREVDVARMLNRSVRGIQNYGNREAPRGGYSIRGIKERQYSERRLSRRGNWCEVKTDTLPPAIRRDLAAAEKKSSEPDETLR
jgi:hypothetical protein